MADFNVKERRNEFIGGSDIPAIMGISPFKTRWQLLLEKAGLAEDTFEGNQYTEYGNVLEPQIRDHINASSGTHYQPDRMIDGDIRYHCDGYDAKSGTILEIKTTSHIYGTVDEYKLYLVQLLAYAEAWGCKRGFLAVYHRPEDFDTELDSARLQLFSVTVEQYADLLTEIHYEIDRFRSDLARLKDNPLLTEQDFVPPEVVAASNEVARLEKQLADFKAVEAQYKATKQSLYDAMEKYDIKSWETYSGAKITRVDAIPAKVETVEELNLESLKKDYPDLIATYTSETQKTKPGRAGYVRITLPKEV